MKPIIISGLMLLSCLIFAAADKVEIYAGTAGQNGAVMLSQLLTPSEASSNIRFSDNAIVNRIVKYRLNRAVNRMGNQPANAQNPVQHFEIDTSRCDRMFLRNGRVIMVHIKEIAYNDIIYSRCGAEDDAEYFVPKSDVIKVETLIGETVYSRSTDRMDRPGRPERAIERPRDYGDGPETEGFGLTAMTIASIALVFAIFISMVVGVILAITALVLAGISDNRLRRFPRRFKRSTNISVARALALVTIIGSVILVVLNATT